MPAGLIWPLVARYSVEVSHMLNNVGRAMSRRWLRLDQM